ncbi:MAG: Rieske 2Fe-2S domain-containing protein [Thermaerobacterales bacterium]
MSENEEGRKAGNNEAADGGKEQRAAPTGGAGAADEGNGGEDRAAAAKKAAAARQAAAAKKAAAAKTDQDDAGDRAVSRRDFVRMGLWGGVLLFLGQITGNFVQLLWPRKLGAFGGRVNLGPVDNFPINTVTKIDPAKTYLAHVDDGLLAIYWRCTHLGCTVPWDPDQNPQHGGCFCCPCHGSQFAITGDYVGGPAPRPLDLFPVEIEAGEVWVDTGTIIERDRYIPNQAAPVPS